MSSVGKIHLPSSTPSVTAEDGNDDAAEPLSIEFRKLLATVTRKQVDSHPTRCPHPETADRMTQVVIGLNFPSFGRS